ncbi:hypothetical protein KP509_01G049900 [Ceratopteris richardii]|nr:hypothetical protein KP509_01G049900 [Ceratopteris richardii]
MTFRDVYDAILLVFNYMNKILRGPQFVPPTKEEVQRMLQDSDTNKNGILDREEFATFIQNFTSDMVKRVTMHILVFVIFTPALAFCAKYVAERLPRLRKSIRSIPNSLYAGFATAGVLLIVRLSHKRLVRSN